MRSIVAWGVILAVAMGAWTGSVSEASESPEISVTVAPVKYIFVDGDSGRFREHHWTKEGYSGGLKEFLAHHTFANGVEFEAASHALIDQNDLGTEIELKKADLGFFELGFQEFRKYYDGNGGTFRLFFPDLGAPETDRDLRLDIGKFELETGLTLENLPELTFLYEREYKDGLKSKLSWGEAEEATANFTRNITPTWLEIDEIVDVFGLTATDEIAGFALSGEQRWERGRSEALRQELDLSTTHGSGDDKIRRQDLAPETNLMTTTLKAQRGFKEDKVFFSSGYQFNHMNNREFESLSEYNGLTGALFSYAFPEQKPNNRADIDYDAHAWVNSMMTQLMPALSLTTRLKSEIIKKQSNSIYNSDFHTTNTSTGALTSATPNGIIDGSDVNNTDTKAKRWGEALSVRFTGIPRTALYTELELEQGRLLLREDLTRVDGPDTTAGADSNNSGAVFNRETVTDVRRGTWTLGTNVAPWSFFNLTAQVKRRVNNQDYDDQRETSGSIRSAFLDGISVHTDEFVTRATYRPARWLRSSFRYQYRDDDYSTWVQSQARVKTNATSHIYTYDVALQPLSDLVLMGSFSRQAAVTSTPARYGATDTNTPAFHADVNTWLFSADYTVSPALALNGNLQHTRARNFDDFSFNGLPLGADFDKVDLATGLTWSFAEDTAISAAYDFYFYQPNSNWGTGDYDAHGISVDVSKKF
jgi:hypothetical protein